MWLIMGFRENRYSELPEPFFVGTFTEHSVALETCQRFNKEKKDDAFYDVISFEVNKIYDYDWNQLQGIESMDQS